MIELVVIGIMAVSCVILYYRGLWKDAQRHLDHYAKTILKYDGWSCVDGHYSIISFDSGVTWWNFKYAHQGYTILGPADSGVVSRQLAVRELGGRAGNPLNLNVEGDVKLLESAGFTVRRNV